MIHTFLRSIGFGDLTKNADLYLILESILNRPDEQNIVKDEYGNEFACSPKILFNYSNKHINAHSFEISGKVNKYPAISSWL